jgi:hypothetical protein
MKDLLKSKKFWAITASTAVTVFTAVMVVRKVRSAQLDLMIEDGCE